MKIDELISKYIAVLEWNCINVKEIKLRPDLMRKMDNIEQEDTISKPHIYGVPISLGLRKCKVKAEHHSFYRDKWYKPSEIRKMDGAEKFLS